MQNFYALLWRFAENLHHMEISLDLKPAHSPQLFQQSVSTNLSAVNTKGALLD